MPRYRFTIEYDGRPYCGWQRQIGQPSVQAAVEAALSKLCGGAPVAVQCAGRTDTGVHATAQVAHADLPRAFPARNLVLGTNFHLEGESVVILTAEEVPDTFHARFSATGRAYVYRIVNRAARLSLDAGRAWHIPEPLDAAAMHRAAQSLLGTHDFTTFRATECQAKSPIKTLERFDITTHPLPHGGQELMIHTQSRSFLHHQVRNMVGSLRMVGNGKWRMEDLLAALEARDRRKGGETAVSDGLYLVNVKY